MAKINQTKLALEAGISGGMLSLILRGMKRAGWKTAQKLSMATKTTALLWLEGSPQEMVEAVQRYADMTEKGGM